MIIDESMSYKIERDRIDVTYDLNDKKLADAEYYKCIVNALKSAIGENEDVSTNEFLINRCLFKAI